MRYRLWEIRENQFKTLVENLGFTSKMKQALIKRYNEECAYPRSLTCITYDVSEHGLMKAEKKILNVHTEIVKAYGD